MKLLTISNTLSVLFLSYMAYTLWNIYSIFTPNLCKTAKLCIQKSPKNYKLQVFTSVKKQASLESDFKLLWDFSNISVSEREVRSFNVTLPIKTRRNGTLYVYAFFFLKHLNEPFNTRHVSIAQSSLTTYMVPQSTFFSLLSDNEQKNKTTNDQPITHWRTKLKLSVLADDVLFDRTQIPGELFPYIRVVDNDKYVPIVYIDELSYRVRDLTPVNISSTEMPLEVTYSPISIGKLRLWIQFQQSMEVLKSLGFSEKDVDEVKGIFADTNLYFLLLTFAVSAIHLLFDVLAFKNDISYWKKRDSMIGLSTRVVVWRCISTIVIFFYLYDAEASLLIIIPTGIGSIIEIWKVKKAFKVKITWNGLRPSFEFGKKSEQEEETQQFDSQAMSYLQWFLYPLVFGGAIYSLFYVQHKSWVSWTLQSLVNGVYAFGFLFMLPQLFVNYKLKSVAHLPWRAFMYKAFNTFIDDIFAFIITMPTSHRLACFRDDVVFVVYLYQRWLYPVDKSRVNEFGMSFDETSSDKLDKKKQ